MFIKLEDPRRAIYHDSPKKFPATKRLNKKDLPLAKLYWCHIGILLFGILLETLMAYLFVSLDIQFSGADAGE